ncbi:serine hydrolase domain-containing protein [Dyella choica]|uniref:serine hydrolase domain-containing protein n=1 Tax=Dyella choica TaxID=1927959 RepID=UPI00131536DA|nr:serine hydrolase domain-containing protein [Dyella choica]
MTHSMKAIHLTFVAGLLAFTGASASDMDSNAAKISEVENGLRPAAAINGKPVPVHSLREEMTAMHVQGVSIAVIDHGRIAWSKGYGVSRHGGAPITPETLFQAGSISKSLTAVAAMQLVQDGKIQLDEDVNGELTSWHFPSNAFTKSHFVTLRQLLSHTGGINVHGFEGYAAGAAVPTLLQVLNGSSPANSPAIQVVSVPGSAWSYSGGGYTVAQQLIIDITRTPFEKWLQQQVLIPANMQHSTFSQVLPPELANYIAMPHKENGEPVAGGPYRYPEMAAAGLWTTPTDLAKFLISIQTAWNGGDGALIQPTTAKEMLKLVKSGSSMGFDIGGSGDDRYFAKGGDTTGFAGQMVAFNSRGEGVVILTNSSDGNALADELIRSVAAAYHWPALQTHMRSVGHVDGKKLHLLAGNYAYGDRGRFSIQVEGGHLSIKQILRPAESMYPQNATTWFTLSDDEKYVFNDDNGASGYIDDGGERVSFHRLKESELK